MNHSLRHRTVAITLIVNLFLLALQSSVIQAAMISTDSGMQSLQVEYSKTQIRELTQSEEARDIMLQLGVSPEHVDERIDRMTAAELAEFNQNLNEMPAGGTSIVGVVVLVFLVLIVLDLLGTTNIFPAIKPVN